MKKLIIYFSSMILTAGSWLHAQDYIITWQNDTIQCNFSQITRMKPRSEYTNGHLVITPVINGSQHVFRPADLKGYFRSRHGRSYLCNGNFYSYQVEYHDRKYQSSKYSDTAHYFMNSLVKGDSAHLLITYTNGSSTILKSYYLKLPGLSKAIRLRDRKHLATLLNPSNPSYLLKNVKKKSPRRSFPSIVKFFNGLNGELN